MQKLVVAVLLDAFRHDYVRYTEFLRKLSRKSFSGKLREPFGFCPRAAYFAGLEPAQSGFTNMYWLDPRNSPFSVGRHINGEAIRSDPSLKWKARAYVDEVARSRSTPFAATYAASIAIPFDALHMFDLAEKFAPWDAGVGYRSLFHALDEAHMPWFECSWPTYDGLQKADDSSILEHTLNQLKPQHTFAYVHFSALDGIGHTHGPGSKACVNAIQVLDRQVERLVNYCFERYAAVDVLIFGDHGMVSVARNVDIASAIHDAGLVSGRDFHYFIDSTMVRFWFATEAARKKMRERLARVPDGFLIDEEMEHDLRIAGCDRRNGELFYLAHPGVQFFPNFFQESGTPPKGMHGYHPNCPDNQAFLLTHLDGQEVGITVGTIDATQIFHTCCDLLRLDNISYDRQCSAIHQIHWERGAPSFTVVDDAETSAVVQGHLNVIMDEIRRTAPDAQAIVLSGGFGRGEGSVWRNGGKPRPLNDYDLLVACDESLRLDLKSAGSRLATRVGLDYVDIGPLSPAWFAKLNLTMFTFDLKYGSRTIWGNESLLESIPQFAPAEIPLWEGYQLLLNRIAGLLIGLKPHMLGPEPWPDTDFRFLVRQMTKAAMAIGDFHLLSLGDYNSSYRQRLSRLQSLQHALNIDAAEIELLERAYTFKLLPDYDVFQNATPFLFDLLERLDSTLMDATQLLLGRQLKANSIIEAMAAWEKEYARIVGPEIAALRVAIVLLVLSVQKNFNFDASKLQELRRRQPTFNDLSGVDLFAQFRSTFIQEWEEKCH